jgi:MoxR-like ATPase
MKIEDFKEIIYNDEYLEIAVKEYIDFKKTEYYKESYKRKILKSLNGYLQNTRITPENVVNVIGEFKKNNPQTGTFTHWTSIDNLLKISSENPVLISKLINNLYDETIQLDERIKVFDEQIKQLKGKSLGTPLYAYLLAGYNYKKYPLFKDEIFREFLKSYSIQEKIDEVSEKYFLYYKITHVFIDYLKEKHFIKEPNALDVQDFIYCLFSSDYYNFVFYVNLKYLHMISKRLRSFKNNDINFINYLNNLDKNYLKKMYDKYSESEKVNLIRFKIAELLLNDEKLNLDKLEEIKKEVSSKYEKNILHSWNNFNILFPFFYEKHNNKVKYILIRLMSILKNEVKKIINLNIQLEIHSVGFEGSRGFGTDMCWAALFPSNKEVHKKAARLDLAINSNTISFGLILGKDFENSEKILKPKVLEKGNKGDFIEVVKEEDYQIDFSIYEKIVNKYKSVIDKFLEYNKIEGGKKVKEKGDNSEYDKDKINWNNDLKLKSLYFENQDNLLSQISTALKSGKHIILVGPPGTGKSKLAKEICKSYNVEFKMVTAMSEWSTYDTIGGYKPKEDGTLEFVEGVFLKLLKSKNNNQLYWLIIDEINRADIDKAFGSFLSVLTGDEVELSLKSHSGKNIIIKPESDGEQKIDEDNIYILPKDFRIIGTMNTYDKTSLYELSYAFMRRFAFIYVGVPRVINEELVETLLSKWDIEDKAINEISLKEALIEIWKITNKYRKIGPAIIRDIANYVSIEGDYVSALILYVLPQFEGVSEDNIRKFIKDLYNSSIKQFKEKEKRQMLENFIYDFFGVVIDENT